MSRVVLLESFLRHPPVLPPAPVFDAADLAAARAEGRAEGEAAARDQTMAELLSAVRDLAAALGGDAARTRQAAALWADELALVARAIIGALAGPLRAEALADRVIVALHGELAQAVPPPAVIRCEAGAAAVLKPILAEAGLGCITVESGGIGAEFTAGDGVLRIAPARIEAALHDIIAEIGEPDGSL